MPRAKKIEETPLPVVPDPELLAPIHQHYTGEIANMWQDVRNKGIIKLNPSYLCGTPRCRIGNLFNGEMPDSKRFHQHFVFGLGMNWWDVERPEYAFCGTGRCREGWYAEKREEVAS